MSEDEINQMKEMQSLAMASQGGGSETETDEEREEEGQQGEGESELHFSKEDLQALLAGSSSMQVGGAGTSLLAPIQGRLKPATQVTMTAPSTPSPLVIQAPTTAAPSKTIYQVQPVSTISNPASGSNLFSLVPNLEVAGKSVVNTPPAASNSNVIHISQFPNTGSAVTVQQLTDPASAVTVKRQKPNPVYNISVQPPPASSANTIYLQTVQPQASSSVTDLGLNIQQQPVASVNPTYNIAIQPAPAAPSPNPIYNLGIQPAAAGATSSMYNVNSLLPVQIPLSGGLSVVAMVPAASLAGLCLPETKGQTVVAGSPAVVKEEQSEGPLTITSLGPASADQQLLQFCTQVNSQVQQVLPAVSQQVLSPVTEQVLLGNQQVLSSNILS